jgi:hypothetical protein
MQQQLVLAPSIHFGLLLRSWRKREGVGLGFGFLCVRGGAKYGHDVLCFFKVYSPFFFMRQSVVSLKWKEIDLIFVSRS